MTMMMMKVIVMITDQKVDALCLMRTTQYMSCQERALLNQNTLEIRNHEGISLPNMECVDPKMLEIPKLTWPPEMVMWPLGQIQWREFFGTFLLLMPLNSITLFSFA